MPHSQVTGEEALYINPFFVESFQGFSPEGSAPLLRALVESATADSSRIVRHRWEAGDVLIWDNALVMHFAENDYTLSEHRLMHRTTAAAPARPAPDPVSLVRPRALPSVLSLIGGSGGGSSKVVAACL